MSKHLSTMDVIQKDVTQFINKASQNHQDFENCGSVYCFSSGFRAISMLGVSTPMGRLHEILDEFPGSDLQARLEEVRKCSAEFVGQNKLLGSASYQVTKALNLWANKCTKEDDRGI